MAIINLFFKKTRAEIGAIQLDVDISESHVYNSTVTKFPVEYGSNISDHIINNPVTLTMTGLISNTPIGFFRGKIGQYIRGEAFERHKIAFEELLFLRDSKIPFTVITTLGEYLNMVFESITFPREVGSSQSLRFTAVMTEVEYVDSETVAFDTIAEQFKNRGSNTISKGQQSKKIVSAAQSGKVSILYKIFGRFF